MKPPKYTDEHRFPHGYMKACDTDITVAWKRMREQIEEERRKREEQLKVVVQMRGPK